MKQQQNNVINTKTYLAKFTMEGLNVGIPNQRVYLKNLGFLTGKTITGIRAVGEFITITPSLGEGTVYLNASPIDATFVLNLVTVGTKQLTVSNLPILSMNYQPAVSGRVRQYTPFNGRYDFDNSWIEKFSLGTFTNQMLFLEFHYLN